MLGVVVSKKTVTGTRTGLVCEVAEKTNTYVEETTSS